MTTRKNTGIAAALVVASAALMTFVGDWEGRSLTPYKDIVGVVTYCDGITQPPPAPGKTYTHQECNALKLKEVTQHGSELLACIDAPITQGMYEAFASWAYNVGTGAACGSTAVRLLNEQRFREACDQLLRWNRAGGKVVRGLDNRRRAEHALCIKSLPDVERTSA